MLLDYVLRGDVDNMALPDSFRTSHAVSKASKTKL